MKIYKFGDTTDATKLEMDYVRATNAYMIIHSNTQTYHTVW